MIAETSTDDILYGTPEQIAVVRRARALYRLVGHNPSFTFQGRTVSYVGCPGESRAQIADRVIDLCRLQGYASAQFTNRSHRDSYTQAYSDARLAPVVWEQYWGRGSALTSSIAFLEAFTPPAGLQLCAVTADTPDQTIHDICQMSVDAGVLPPSGSVMRGQGPKGVMLFVKTGDGQVVASGGGYMSYHPDSTRHDEAFWGMLATHADWRGQRLACWVGAKTIQILANQFGARGFSSGVKADNPSSQAMCARLGIYQSDYLYVGATDPILMGTTAITR
ncbi:hypothetical protein QEZ52_19235 [Aliisedimentitalea scapharcae]|uniref:N-acetyltransferase domain-containing protein n=1 Tax=Aliisedimentitalea scapharcae TaxID=1524259 RepID=A0ABZ2XRZ1_9RHOB